MFNKELDFALHGLVQEDLHSITQASVWNRMRGQVVPKRIFIYKNPTLSEIQRQMRADPMKEVRGILMQNGDIYSWECDVMSHESFMQKFKKTGTAFYVRESDQDENLYDLLVSSFTSGYVKMPLNDNVLNMLPERMVDYIRNNDLSEASSVTASDVIRYETDGGQDTVQESLHSAIQGSSWNMTRMQYVPRRMHIFKNPTPSEVARILEDCELARGLMDDDGNIYLWEAEGLMHETVRDKLGKDGIPFYVGLPHDLEDPQLAGPGSKGGSTLLDVQVSGWGGRRRPLPVNNNLMAMLPRRMQGYIRDRGINEITEVLAKDVVWFEQGDDDDEL